MSENNHFNQRQAAQEIDHDVERSDDPRILALSSLVMSLVTKENNNDGLSANHGRKEYEDFVLPIWNQFDKIHQDYKTSFTKYQDSLLVGSNFPDPVANLVRIIKRDSLLTSDFRFLLSKAIQSYKLISLGSPHKITEPITDPQEFQNYYKKAFVESIFKYFSYQELVGHEDKVELILDPYASLDELILDAARGLEEQDVVDDPDIVFDQGSGDNQDIFDQGSAGNQRAVVGSAIGRNVGIINFGRIQLLHQISDQESGIEEIVSFLDELITQIQRMYQEVATSHQGLRTSLLSSVETSDASLDRKQAPVHIEFVGGDKITTGDISGTTGIAVGKEVNVDVNQNTTKNDEPSSQDANSK